MISRKELGDYLANEGYRETFLSEFGQKLFIIVPNLEKEDVLAIIKSLTESIKNKIKISCKQDRYNGKKIEKYQEEINTFNKELAEDFPEKSDDTLNELSSEENDISVILDVSPSLDNNEAEEDFSIKEESAIQEAKEPTPQNEPLKEKGIKVQITGEIKNPGVYFCTDGSTINDLIQSAGGVKETADLDDIPVFKILSDGETISIPIKYVSVHIQGGVEKEGTYSIPIGSSMDDLLREAGGPKNADMSQIDYSQKIKDNCIITIPSLPERWADISGAVNKPGYYQISENERLGQLIDKAEGLLPEADIDNINMASMVTDGEKIIIPRKRLRPGSHNIFSDPVKDSQKETSTVIEKKNEENEEKTENKQDFGLLIKGKTTGNTHFAEPVKIPTDRERNKYFGMFKWIKSCIIHNVNRLPKSVQTMLEDVEDPVKLNILTTGFFDGLSVDKLKRLLQIQKTASTEKLKELVSFYIKLENNNYEGRVENEQN